MVKYYRRKVYRPRDKYSVEQSAINADISAGQTTTVVVVPGVATQGVRKVKHLTVSMQSPSAADGVWWALVYVPAGTSPSAFNLTTGGPLYEPNQYVLNCGVVDFSSGPTRISSPVSRNLHSGDQIALLVQPAASTTLALSGLVRYAICYN
jgi:hypothetical protein